MFERAIIIILSGVLGIIWLYVAARAISTAIVRSIQQQAGERTNVEKNEEEA